MQKLWIQAILAALLTATLALSCGDAEEPPPTPTGGDMNNAANNSGATNNNNNGPDLSCTSDAQCGAAEVCNRDVGECQVAEFACERDLDCDLNERCSQVTGFCEPAQGDSGCERDSDCDEVEECNRALGICIPRRMGTDGCVRDEDCGVEERCDPETRECVPRPEDPCELIMCAADAVCNPLTGFCQLPECSDDAPCGEDEVCREGICHPEMAMGCAGDEGCEDGQVCDVESGVCQEAMSGCQVDGCPDGEVCDAATGACAAIDCNDPYEGFSDNDEATRAFVLPRADVYPDAASCGDADFYRFTLDQTATVWARVDHAGQGGDLGLALYDGDGVEIFRGESEGDTEAVAAPALEAGDYLLEVLPDALDAPTRYDLELQIDPAFALCRTAFECGDFEACVDLRCQPAPCNSDVDCGEGGACGDDGLCAAEGR